MLGVLICAIFLSVLAFGISFCIWRKEEVRCIMGEFGYDYFLGCVGEKPKNIWGKHVRIFLYTIMIQPQIIA